MMHYRKAENIEKQLTKEELPFQDFLPKGTDFLWMHVNGGTKVNNVITYAKKALDKGEHKCLVWSGNGGGVIKTISCAEILKRSYPLYQVTRMCYTTVEEHWKPQTEGLDEIVANRQIPSLHIYMSLEAVDDSISGLQNPNSKTDFWIYNESSQQHNNNNGGGVSLNNRNQRQRSVNQGPGRANRPRPHNASSSNAEAQQLQTKPDTEGNSETNHQNKTKRRKPRPNKNRGGNGPAGPSNKGDGNANQVEPMEN